MPEKVEKPAAEAKDEEPEVETINLSGDSETKEGEAEDDKDTEDKPADDQEDDQEDDGPPG